MLPSPVAQLLISAARRCGLTVAGADGVQAKVCRIRFSQVVDKVGQLRVGQGIDRSEGCESSSARICEVDKHALLAIIANCQQLTSAGANYIIAPVWCQSIAAVLSS